MQGSSDPHAELLDAVALVGHLVSPDSVYGFLAAHRQRLFPDELFADLFPSGRGRPSVPADVVATVVVLQSLEGLSDRDALERLRCDIRWKVATGLPLDDGGFHPSTLTYWRNRLRASGAPQRIFDAVREVIAQTGVLKGRTARALDSTVLDDAVATQDTVTQLVAQIRRVRRVVPEARDVALAAHDYDAAGKPLCAWDDPGAREALVSGLVNDALAVIARLEQVELDHDQRDAVALLALVAGQDVEPGDTPGSWRIAQRTAPDRVISTVDPQSRHVHKSVRSYRDGFKAHVAVEPDTGLITAAAVTAGNAPDGPTGVALLADEPEPVDVLADSAYGAGATRAALTSAGHRQIIKPIPLRPMTAAHDAFIIDDFDIDLDARTVTCPASHTVAITARGNACFGVRCGDCPLQARCTRARRGKTIHVHRHHDQLAQARRDATDPDWQQRYRRSRPMVERTLAWLVANGHRRARYRGIDRNELGLGHRAAAINLRRLINLGLTATPEGWALPT